MELKRFSRVEIIQGLVPLTAEFVRHEPDSDYSWYKVFTKEQFKRIAAYYGIDY